LSQISVKITRHAERRVFFMPKSVKYHPEVDKLEHDDATSPDTKRVSVYGWDSNNLRKTRLAIDENGDIGFTPTVRVLESSEFTYVGLAIPGANTADSVWRCMRIDDDGNVLHADGDTAFNNIATDLTALSYS
jgi:hypothetical protein